MTRDWIEWHRAYDDPHSSLSQRLAVVSRMIRDVLDTAPPGEIRVLSLCAGDGRDLTLAATDHPRRADLTGLLVELNPELATLAVANVATVSAGLKVANADAAATAVFRSTLPVDLLLLCGIFGNVSNGDIEHTITAVPAMCSPGATVIWTRHRQPPDITPSIREWFDGAGCTAIEFVSPGPGGFAIGRELSRGARASASLPERLFTFRPELR